MRQIRRRQPTGETVPHSLSRAFVVVKYLAAPAMPADPQDSRSLAVSEPEARSGIFHLQRFGQLGIEVCNETEEGMLNRLTFIPWEAVLSIRSTTEQERAGGGG
jgi:hypothetical protein